VKKNVLQITGSFHQGGSERQAVQLVRLLNEEGSYRVFVACLSGEGVLRREIEQIGYRDVPEFLLVSFYDANMARQLRRCAKFIRDNNIEIVQTHDFYTNVFGMAAGALAKVPVRIAAKRETGMRSSAQKFVERRAFNIAHAIVTNADAVKNYLIESGVAARKITTIYNGLDLQRLSPAETNREKILQEFGLSVDKKMRFVIIVANLRSAVKNHQMFLRAARKVKEKVENVNFIVAGEGELIDETKAFAGELGLGKDVFFTGRCSKVAELLSISDVCVLSSESEGFSNSILEYMAAAKPVVATAVGGASEAIIENETGFLVVANDDQAMANRMIELIENPGKAKAMGVKGRKIVEEKFSVAAQIEKTLTLYEMLLSRKKLSKKKFGFLTQRQN
jgi:glycosyltransferase involved in cell wall biosynthesis